MFQKMKIAVIGCGMISDIYLKNLKNFDVVDLVGCADIRAERAKEKAEAYQIQAMTNQEIYDDPEISLVVNLTYPTSHYTVAKEALLAGKHVYTEKMMVATMEEADELLALAKEKQLFCGGAPDTFFSASFQLARQILDSGMLGTPTTAEIFLSRDYRHERWNCAPYKRFAFCPAGGIPFDMGAYYFSALVFLLGSVKRAGGIAEIREPERYFQHPNSPLFEQEMRVESFNQAVGTLQFTNGTLASVAFTSEGGTTSNRFVIHCTDGCIDLGDPNNYESCVTIKNKAGEESVIHSNFAFHSGNFRGVGIADAIYALQNNRPARCSGDLCRHVLEIARAICYGDGKIVELSTEVARPAPLATGYTEYPELVFRR